MPTMSKRIVWALAGVAALALGAAGSVRSQGPQPKIEIPETRHDFGTVFERKQYIHEFAVYNRGDADLIIESVQPGCGCTVTNFDRVIAPGKMGKIEFVLDGEKVHDAFNKKATVKSNDPVHGTMTIAVTGKEIPYLDVSPPGTVYLHGRYGEHVERTLTVTTNENDLDFKIVGITSDIDDKITYKVHPGSKAGSYDVAVYKNPALPTLITYGMIYLHTTSKESPKTGIQVNIITKGDITVSPPAVNFGPVKFAEGAGSGQAITRDLVVSKTAGDFAVKNVTLNNSHFKAYVESVAEGKQYRIQVVFTPPLKTSEEQAETAEMTIHTSDAKEPAIRVHVVARAL
jgi:Protein of unknown function (DUF1573)